MSNIKENLDRISKEIKEAALASEYAKEVTLIAVSKTHPAGDIMEAYEWGIRDFGENKVQELCGKMEELPEDINWHMIGHLQTNKVKYIAGKTALIHSVDSIKLAREIDRCCKNKGLFQDILVQVNISEEESKFGTSRDDAITLVKNISTLENIRVRGLMTIAPYTDDAQKSRPYFRELRNLSIDISKLNIDNIHMDLLSMGMSGDYITAIEEGAGLVRIGTGIFGARNYL